MIAAILRLFALRPFFTLAIFGVPLIVLVVVGLFTIMAIKFLILVVLPIALLVWLLRKLLRPSDDCAP
jgi:hypothetical protein